MAAGVVHEQADAFVEGVEFAEIEAEGVDGAHEAVAEDGEGTFALEAVPEAVAVDVGEGVGHGSSVVGEGGE